MNFYFVSIRPTHHSTVQYTYRLKKKKKDKNYKTTKDPKIIGYTDSDSAGSVDDRKSALDYVFTFGLGVFA